MYDSRRKTHTQIKAQESKIPKEESAVKGAGKTA